MTTNGHIQHLDPRELIVDANVRRDAGLTEDFISSLTEHGVIQPVHAYQAQDGTVHVIAGQRRTLGAIQAELATIPVYVTDEAEDSHELAVQITENLHRSNLTDADTAAGIEQLAAFGLDAKQIAKSLAMTQKQVKATRAVSASAAGAKALQDGLTIDQAALLAEFSEHPDELAELEEVAATQPEALAHAAANARSDIERTATREAEKAAALERGLDILDNDPTWTPGAKAVALHELTHADGSPATEKDATAVYFGYRTVYAVTDWKGAGLSRNGSQAGGGMTEDQKAERREVIENNRLMNDANGVRIQWLTDTLNRAKLPAKSAQWAAAILATRNRHISPTAAADVTGKESEHEFSQWAAKTPSKAAHVVLALAVSTFEGYMHKGVWRDTYPDQAMITYLQQLESWGYTLSDIEQTITAKKN